MKNIRGWIIPVLVAVFIFAVFMVLAWAGGELLEKLP